ncbi:MAG: hypothetical protein ACK4K7_02990 [Allosphingosinicella sp.]|uniref:hypothetical protein n=1 Tax=Allosphingosinicella sp. TaxID=2823234 RepID=UPI0039473557
MHLPGSPSPGEVGGVFAGIVTVLALLGGGVRWLVSWRERRAEARSAKLQRWHEELDARERRLDAEEAERSQRLEDRQGRLEVAYAQLHRENAALRIAFELIAAPLRLREPENPALKQAEEMLKAVFPISPLTPPPMVGLMDQLHKID